MKREKKVGTQTNTQTDDTHPGRIIVPDGIYSVGYKKWRFLNLSISRLQMSHTISSSQSGRKITAAAANTGKAVVSTGKAVGGAIFTARSSISSWWHGGKRSKVEEENDGDDDIASDD